VNGGYNGWTRLSGQQWQAAVHAADEDTAWRLLHQHVDQMREKMIDLYVAPVNVDPRSRRRSRKYSKQVRLNGHHPVPDNR